MMTIEHTIERDLPCGDTIEIDLTIEVTSRGYAATWTDPACGPEWEIRSAVLTDGGDTIDAGKVELTADEESTIDERVSERLTDEPDGYDEDAARAHWGSW